MELQGEEALDYLNNRFLKVKWYHLWTISERKSERKRENGRGIYKLIWTKKRKREREKRGRERKKKDFFPGALAFVDARTAVEHILKLLLNQVPHQGDDFGWLQPADHPLPPLAIRGGPSHRPLPGPRLRRLPKLGTLLARTRQLHGYC